MMGQLIGNLTNMILDPILISGFGWGIEGCALATLIGETVGTLYYLQFYLRGKSVLHVGIRNFTVKGGTASSVLAIGIPAALGSVLMSVSQILMNAEMAQYGDMELAGIGVAMKIVMITGMISMGIGQGVQPLLGYSFGAGYRERFKKYMKFSLLFATGLGIALTVLCYAFVHSIVGAFLTEEKAFDYAVMFSRILLVTGPLFGVFYCVMNALQAMGDARSSLIVNVSRQGLIYIPTLFILNALIGVMGLAWAQPCADILSMALGLFLYRRAMRKRWS